MPKELHLKIKYIKSNWNVCYDSINTLIFRLVVFQNCYSFTSILYKYSFSLFVMFVLYVFDQMHDNLKIKSYQTFGWIKGEGNNHWSTIYYYISAQNCYQHVHEINKIKENDEFSKTSLSTITELKFKVFIQNY